ncbi:unnamed protein product [Candida verbasci]|uniref:Thioredoxin domain-containing protein n=1 Tax=Candida verbasci TaxID=1227364 RepID=A0A9W4XB65_9ASCO|nr:unnamed protein product [Candida verbasci]
MVLIEIENENQFSELTKNQDSSKLIALYFYTDWAGPCKQMNQVFKTISEQTENSNILFLSINADNLEEVSELFEVSSVPYFILIKNNTILKEISGSDPKELITALNKYNNNDTNTTNIAKTINNQQQQQQQQQQQPIQNNTNEEEEEEESEEALNQRLEKLTKAAPIMLFMKGSPSSPQCGFSRQLVAILREHQVKFGFFDILKDDSVRQGLKKFSDWPTFPQLYINGEFQGGLDIIKENLEEDDQYFEHAFNSE